MSEEIKNKKKRQIVVGAKQTHQYYRQELLEKVKKFPNLRLTVGQILVLFPDYTANQLKHFRSSAYKGNDSPPCDQRHGRPAYIYNQFHAWHHKLDIVLNDPYAKDEKNTAEETAKTAKRVKAVK